MNKWPTGQDLQGMLLHSLNKIEEQCQSVFQINLRLTSGSFSKLHSTKSVAVRIKKHIISPAVFFFFFQFAIVSSEEWKPSSCLYKKQVDFT